MQPHAALCLVIISLRFAFRLVWSWWLLPRRALHSSLFKKSDCRADHGNAGVSEKIWQHGDHAVSGENSHTGGEWTKWDAMLQMMLWWSKDTCWDPLEPRILGNTEIHGNTCAMKYPKELLQFSHCDISMHFIPIRGCQLWGRCSFGGPTLKRRLCFRGFAGRVVAVHLNLGL